MPKRKPERERRFHFDRRIDQIIKSDNKSVSDETFYDTKQAADWWCVSPTWFALGRIDGYGPPVTRFTATQFAYKVGDLRKWLRERAKMLEAA